MKWWGITFFLIGFLFFPWISQREGKMSGYFCRSCIYTQSIIKIRHNCFMWSFSIDPVLFPWFLWKCRSTISQHRNILWRGYEQTILCSFKISVSYIYALALAFIEALYVWKWKQTSTWSQRLWCSCKSNVTLNMIFMLVEMGPIIGNSVFPCMVGSPITSVPSMAGRVRSDFTSEHNSSLHIPKQSVSRNQIQLVT